MAPSKKELRKFGLLVGAFFAAWAAYRMYRRGGAPLAYGVGGAGTILLLLGAVAPRVLALPYASWMRLGTLLGWVNTRVLLGVMFFVVVTPIAILGRLFGHDPLDRGKRSKRSSKQSSAGPAPELSYWRDHDDRDEPDRYKRQF